MLHGNRREEDILKARHTHCLVLVGQDSKAYTVPLWCELGVEWQKPQEQAQEVGMGGGVFCLSVVSGRLHGMNALLTHWPNLSATHTSLLHSMD